MSGMIVPDFNNPFQPQLNDQETNGKQFVFKFSLPSTSKGLVRGAVVGADFSEADSAATAVQFTNANFGCALSEVGVTNTFTVKNGNGATASSIATCQLDDELISKRLEAGKNYQLIITPTFNFSTRILNTVGFFTATSSDAGKVYVDSTKVFASAYLYPNFKADFTNPLVIESTDNSVRVTAGSSTESSSDPGTNIYLGDTFFAIFSFKSSSRIPADYDFIIEYDGTAFEPFTQVESLDFIENTTDISKQKLDGTLTVEQAETGKARIKGIATDIVPGRQFKLKLSGWIAKKVTNGPTTLAMAVYYKNSHTLYSYSQNTFYMDVKNILFKSDEIRSESYHSWLATGMTWPLRISFTPNITVSNVHVVISNISNVQAGFNAATCDFSGNTGFQNTFGGTSFCRSKSPNDASSISFFAATLTKDESFNFSVFTHISNISTSTNKLVSGSDNVSKLKFNIKVYQTAAISGTSHSYFTNMIADQDTSESVFSCSNAVNPTKVWNDKFPNPNEGSQSQVVFLAAEYNQLQIQNVPLNSNVFAWDMNSTAVNGINDSNGNLAYNRADGVTANLADLTTNRKYLLTSTNKAENLNVSIIAQIKQNTGGKNAYIWIPTDYLTTDDSTTPAANLQEHYLEIGYQKKWFSTGLFAQSITEANFDQLCYTSWDVVSGTTFDFSYALDFGSNTAPTASEKNTKVKTIPGVSTDANSLKNIFHQGDSTFTNIQSAQLPSPNDTLTHYFLKGVTGINSSDNIGYRFPCKADNCDVSGNNLYFGFFTTCLKWKTGITSTNVYDNVEVLFSYKKLSNDRPSRMIRLISFVTMEGFFDNGFVEDGAATSFGNITYNASADISTGLQGVCLTSISNNQYQKTGVTGTGDTLVLFVYNMALFETDYNSLDNSYPIPDLRPGIKAYGFSTAGLAGANDVRLTSGMFGGVASDADKFDVGDLYSMSTAIWFNASTDMNIISFENTTNHPIVIPHYCTETPASGVTNGMLVSSAWVTATNYGAVTKINKKFRTMTNNKMFELVANSDLQKAATPANNHIFLRMNLSALNTSSKTLTADPASHIRTGGTTSQLTTSRFVAAIFSENVVVDSTTAISQIGTVKTHISSNEIPFYFNGSKFIRVVYALSSTNLNIYDSTTTNDVAFSFSGINKPNLTNLVTATGTLNLQNNVVVTSGVNGTGSVLASNINNKIAYVSLIKSIYNWTINYSSAEGSFYQNTGKVNLNIINPAGSTTDNLTFPIGTPLQVGLPTALVDTAFCAITSDATKYAKQCTFSSTTNRFTCVSPIASTSFNICCFNMNFTTTTTNLVANYLAIDYTPATNNFYSYAMFDKTTNFGAGTSFTTVALPEPELTSISYIHSQTLGGITDARLVVNLKKPLEYNARITVVGNFSAMQNYDQVPHCTATVSSDGKPGAWDSGDNLIKSCTISNFSSTTDGQIIIDTKKEIFSCNQENGSNIYITLSQVKIADLSAATFKTTLGVVGGATFVNPTTSKAATASFTNATVTEVDSANNSFTLCNLTTIFPKVLGAAADYTFTIVYTSVFNTFSEANKFPNEVSIFLPFSQFHELGSTDLFCSSSITSGPVDCTVSSGAINFNFRNGDIRVNPVDNVNSFTVTVHNLINTKMALNAFQFSCSLNEISAKQVRTVMAKGRGQYANTLGNATTTGVLSFDNSLGALNAAKNPRTQASTFEFGLVIDKAGVHDPNTFVIDKDPMLYIEFPSTFAISKYTGTDLISTPSIEIKQILQDETKTVFTLFPEQTIAFGNGTVNGNTLSIKLNSNVTDNANAFSFSKYIEYFTVRITNVRTPEDVYVTSGILNCYIANSDFTTIYRTFTNTNNMYIQAIEGNTTLLNFYRGFRFNWDQRNWVVNISNDSTGARSNYLNLQAGFYSSIKASILDFANLEPYASKSVIAFDNSFTHSLLGDEGTVNGSTVTLFSVKNQAMFKMGVPCGTRPGRYLVKVTSTGQDAAGRTFITEGAIFINVTYAIRDVVCTLPSNLIPKDASVPFSCAVPEVVDDYNLVFTNANTEDNFSNAKIDTFKLGYKVETEFSTNFSANRDTTNTINMTGTTGNECLKFSGSSETVSFNFSLTDNSLPTLADSSFDTFYYNTRAQDSQLAWDELNMFVTIPEYSRLACAVTCTNLDYPTDAQIKSQRDITATEKLNFFKYYSTSSTASASVKIGGLMRQTSFKVKCFLMTTTATGESASLTREFSLMNKASDATSPSTIILESSILTRCVQFNLEEDLADDIKQRIVNYCQNKFSVNNNISTGCIVCSDIDQKIYAEGTSLSPFTCQATQALRALQDTTTPTDTATGPTAPVDLALIKSAYIVCATQDLICPTAQLDVGTFTTAINTFISELTKDKINNVVNASQPGQEKAADAKLVGTELILDDVMPTFEICTAGDGNINEGCIYTSNGVLDYLGKAEIDVTIRSNMKCYWKVLPKPPTTPDQAEIMNCDNKRCGWFYAHNSRVSKVAVSDGIKLTREVTFAIYLTCPSHNVINPRNKSTRVISLFEKIIPPVSKSCPLPELDLKPDEDGCTCFDLEKNVVNQGTDGAACGSTFIGLTFLFVLSLLALII